MSKFRRGYPFSKKGLTALLKKLEECEKALPKLEQRFVELSLDFMYERAATHIEESTGNGSYVPTGELLAGLRKDYETGKLFNDCAHAVWVEYGTGVVGEGTHPSVKNGYEYDVNQHGEKGWVYFKDGKFYWTKGMQAHHFWYDTIVDYQLVYKRIFSIAFDEVMGGVME